MATGPALNLWVYSNACQPPCVAIAERTASTSSAARAQSLTSRSRPRRQGPDREPFGRMKPRRRVWLEDQRSSMFAGSTIHPAHHVARQRRTRRHWIRRPFFPRVTSMKKLAVFALVAFGGTLCVRRSRLRCRCLAVNLKRQGVSSSAIMAFIDEAEKKIDSLHSFMLVRHGHVVAEGWWSPYEAESPHSLYSLSKSFTSTAVGLAIAEGKLSLDDEVLKFFPDDAPKEPSKNLQAMRVSDLLRMSTGHQAEVRLAQVGAGAGRRSFWPSPSRSSRVLIFCTTRRRPTCSPRSSRRRPV